MTADDSNASGDGRAEPDAEESSSDGDGECFVIAPIGDPRTDTRRQTDGLLEEAIRPVVEERIGLDVTAAHQMPEAGSITRQVLQRLLEAELVVADLTGLNANVMYELAVRHAKGRPVVPIAEKGTSLPFDITTERTVFYEESFHGLNELKPKLEDAARAALDDEEPDNPIHRAQQDFQMREAVAGDDAMEFILEQLLTIESVVRRDSQRSNMLSKVGFGDVQLDLVGPDDQVGGLLGRIWSILKEKGVSSKPQILGSSKDKHHLLVQEIHPEDFSLVRDAVREVTADTPFEIVEASPPSQT
jgi:hypothetical protein